MPEYKSYYEILQITPDASVDEIKSAFRRLAHLHHPDKNNNSEESKALFILIHNAYSILSDGDKKREYDLFLANSEIFKNTNKQKTNKKTRITDSPFGGIVSITSRLNYTLWELEDFMRKFRLADWKRLLNGVSLESYLLEILRFIDEKILTPSGFPDYFLIARRLGNNETPDYLYSIGMTQNPNKHKPFVSLDDYFFNIRKRTDLFLNKAKLSLIMTSLPDNTRVIDRILEVENQTIQYLALIYPVISR